MSGRDEGRPSVKTWKAFCGPGDKRGMDLQDREIEKILSFFLDLTMV